MSLEHLDRLIEPPGVVERFREILGQRSTSTVEAGRSGNSPVLICQILQRPAIPHVERIRDHRWPLRFRGDPGLLTQRLEPCRVELALAESQPITAGNGLHPITEHLAQPQHSVAQLRTIQITITETLSNLVGRHITAQIYDQ